ncbi:MAG TPA: beta-ketoacyl synthase N-terminal-like domain-containing protein [Thermoanaerobaculia bacterium]|nr:beta-ketoacyl synthase N-terminal-like domain-containing protein [Thermoanaerobaculia bacterium]
MSAGSADAVITGYGVVTSAGCDRSTCAAALAASRGRFTEIDRGAGYHRRPGARLGATVAASELTPWLSPAQARRMSPPSRFAVAAARQAIEQAGLEPPERTRVRSSRGETGVFLGTSYGPSSYSERILRQVFLEGPTAASPMLFTESVANAPAAQVALLRKAYGPNVTVTEREASAVMALGRAALAVAEGRASSALAGGVEELCPLLHAVLDGYRALAHGDDEAPRPFDARRRGFVAGEGAVVAVVERERDAAARGARPLGRIGFFARGFDPTAAPTSWSERPAPLSARLGVALDEAGWMPESIDLVVSGASGSRPGDRAEARVLRTVWGERPLPPVLAPKAVLGEWVGAPLIAGLAALEGGHFGATPGFEQVDPELGLVPHDGRELEPPRRILLSVLSAGGAGAWLGLEGAPR